jgi:hypothetical protein
VFWSFNLLHAAGFYGLMKNIVRVLNDLHGKIKRQIMKRKLVVLLPAVVLAVAITPDFSIAQDTGYAVTERGAGLRRSREDHH